MCASNDFSLPIPFDEGAFALFGVVAPSATSGVGVGVSLPFMVDVEVDRLLNPLVSGAR